MNSIGGKRALVSMNNNDEIPYNLCISNFMKIKVENIMKQFKVFIKSKVSIMERLYIYIY